MVGFRSLVAAASATLLAASLTGGLATPRATALESDSLPCPIVHLGAVHVKSGTAVTYDVATCNLTGVVVEGDYAKAVVPVVGRQVVAQILLVDPLGGETLSAETSLAGKLTVTVTRDTPAAQRNSVVPEIRSSVTTKDKSGDNQRRVYPNATTPPNCSNHSAPPFTGYRPKLSRDTFDANLSPIPSGMSTANFENSIRVGATNLNLNKNNCGVADAQNVSWYYGGRTTANPSIDRAFTCSQARQSGIDVIRFITIDNKSYLAGTCTYKRQNSTQIDYWDMGLRYDAGWWASGASCPGSGYHLESILTHELGHALGLAHDPNNSSAVMFPSFAQCTARNRLSWGEATTINNHY